MDEIFLSPLLQRVIEALPPGVDVYLVGGAVRDTLLGRKCYDLDFVLARDALKIARTLADDLGGAYYPLDTEREYARIVLPVDDKTNPAERMKLDFANYQGDTLDDDLHRRDFTINAMAINVRQPDRLIDPMRGSADLAAKRLRTCSSESMNNDPIRILRAVRQALTYDLKIVPETIRLMRHASSRLIQISPERIRDELFKILDGPHPRLGIEILDRVGALDISLPSLSRLKGVDQSLPHIYDVWEHTLEVVSRLSSVLAALSGHYDPESTSNLMYGLLSIRLGRYRQTLQAHLAEQLNPDRSMRGLLFMAALYHDAGKYATRAADEHERIRFFGHDQEGELLATELARSLRLSNLEVERLSTIVRHHMRPFLMSQMEGGPTRRAIYRFFRDTGAAGVDICVLSLADMLATYGPTLQQDDWAHHLDVIRSLLEAWWEKPEEQVTPRSLINGNDLMSTLGLSPGPQVGELLEAIREAQATGQVNSREQALILARQMIDNLG